MSGINRHRSAETRLQPGFCVFGPANVYRSYGVAQTSLLAMAGMRLRLGA
jgi:hypothetical protein